METSYLLTFNVFQKLQSWPPIQNSTSFSSASICHTHQKQSKTGVLVAKWTVRISDMWSVSCLSLTCFGINCFSLFSSLETTPSKSDLSMVEPDDQSKWWGGWSCWTLSLCRKLCLVFCSFYKIFLQWCISCSTFHLNFSCQTKQIKVCGQKVPNQQTNTQTHLGIFLSLGIWILCATWVCPFCTKYLDQIYMEEKNSIFQFNWFVK